MESVQGRDLKLYETALTLTPVKALGKLTQ